MKTIVDLTYLETVCEGDKEFMQEMIQAFLTTIPDNMNEIKTLAGSGEWAELARVAHKMKPSVTFMGIEPLKEKIVAMESAAKQGTDITLMKQMIGEIETIVEQAVVELKRLVDEI